MKKLFLLLTVLCLSISGLSGLSQAGVITPFWAYTAQITPGLVFDGNYATASISVICSKSVYKIEGVLRLDQELSPGIYANEESWNLSADTYFLTYTASSVRITRGNTYRVSFEGTVYSTNGSEPIYAQILRLAQ